MGTTISTATKISDSQLPVNQTVKNTTQQLGKDEFLKLLLAQMKYQDPMNPMDNTQSIAQMAQFSSLEKMENLNKTLESFGTYQKSLNSINGANFIGKDLDFTEKQMVKTKDPKTGNEIEKEEVVDITGKVSAISYIDGEPYFKVLDADGKEHTTRMENIKNVKDSTISAYSANTKLNQVIAGSAMVGRTIEGIYVKKEEDSHGKMVEIENKVKGQVKSVSFTGDTPVLKILGEDGNEYTVKMEKVLSIV